MRITIACNLREAQPMRRMPERLADNRLTRALAKMLVRGRHPFRVPGVRALARALVMRGLPHPFYCEDTAVYWASRTTRTAHSPEQYLAADEVTEAVLGEACAALPATATFLEIGCNAGRNLEYLRRRGFVRLTGVDINRGALEETLPRHLPELARCATLHAGDAAAWLRTLPDASADVVFSISVLLHIMPAQRSLFADMVRVCCGRLVIANDACGYPYPYDYARLFTRLGCTLQREERIGEQLIQHFTVARQRQDISGVRGIHGD